MTRAAAAALAAAVLLGCPASHAPRRAAPAPLPLQLEVPPLHDEFALAGVVHVVGPGETMWRIARAYGIDPADLMETNGIADPRAVAVGTELFVPGATRVVGVGAEGATSTPTPISTSDAPDREPVHPERSAAEEAARSRRAPTSTSTSTRSAGSPSPPRLASAAARAASGRGVEESDAPLAWPLKGVLYGRYGVRAKQRHDGIDIAAPEGTPVLAAADGTVIYAGEQAGYGAIVIVRHAAGLVTLYAHNSRLLVEDGDRVRKGQPIARVGQTGRTTGPHLHFEVRQGTRPKNPLLFLP